MDNKVALKKQQLDLLIIKRGVRKILMKIEIKLEKRERGERKSASGTFDGASTLPQKGEPEIRLKSN